MQSICDCIPSNIPDVHKGTPKKKWIASDLCQQEIWIPRGWKGENPTTTTITTQKSLCLSYSFISTSITKIIVVLWYLHKLPEGITKTSAGLLPFRPMRKPRL